MSDENKNFICSFCRRTKNQVGKLIAGRDPKGHITFICDMCTETCYEALKRDYVNNTSKGIKLLSPKEIYESLCDIVEGQDSAKKILSTAAYNHYKRVLLNNNDDKIEKSNILIMGKSGTGKTLLVETLSKILNVPFVSIDATTLTEAGYVGEDVEVCISRLLQVAKYDVNKAQTGIVFIDEIDKLRKAIGSNDTKDVSGAGVQHGLLRMIEGSIINVPANGGKKHNNQECIQVDTKNILFICAGAFEDLPQIVSKDIKQAAIGFHGHSSKKAPDFYEDILKHLTQEHLIRYGIIPELLGRLQVWMVLNELKKDDLISILIKPKNALLKQYQKLLDLKDKAKLTYSQDALESIANSALKCKSGARGLRKILEGILLPVMFDVPSLGYKAEVSINVDANGQCFANIVQLEKLQEA